MPGHPLYRMQLRVISDQLSDRLTCCSIASQYHGLTEASVPGSVNRIHAVLSLVPRLLSSLGTRLCSNNYHHNVYNYGDTNIAI